MTDGPYSGRKTDFYLATEEVAETVNLAIELGRPLLVEGEAGCGKTMLAYSIAKEIGLGNPIKISVKSTSQARDLLYRVDALRRLQDAQDRKNTQAKFIYPYISLGPLGRAIHDRKRCVVLIDEIDKADIDFPNDLLDVLDTFTFQVDDLPLEEEEESAKKKGFRRNVSSVKKAHPIVIITSNREKRLPEPFLRRCLYLQLGFPEAPAVLVDIVRKNTKLSPKELNQSVLQAAVERFQKIRGLAKSIDVQKLPTTSELIDWVKILHWKGKKKKDLEKDDLFPPYWQTLFKTMHDQKAYPAAAERARKSK